MFCSILFQFPFRRSPMFLQYRWVLIFLSKLYFVYTTITVYTHYFFCSFNVFVSVQQINSSVRARMGRQVLILWHKTFFHLVVDTFWLHFVQTKLFLSWFLVCLHNEFNDLKYTHSNSIQFCVIRWVVDVVVIVVDFSSLIFCHSFAQIIIQFDIQFALDDRIIR